MGLATVYGIVKQHSGHITIDSDHGKGTTFRIYIPYGGGPEARAEKSTRSTMPRGTETILVVDDEKTVCQLLMDTLQPLGYYILEALSGEEALRISREFKKKIDLLLTDVIMTGMNGRELSLQFRSERPDTKIIFMSGYTDDAISHHGVLEDGVILVNKPLSPSAIAQKIREVLDSSV